MSVRPPAFTWNEELHFGPPSEPVHIQRFIDEAERHRLRGRSPWLEDSSQGLAKDPTQDSAACEVIAGWKEWQGLPDEAKSSVISDCNLDDLKTPLSALLKSQKHVSFLQKTHAAEVGALSAGPSSGKKKGKGKEHGNDSEVELLKQAIEQTPLKMWKLMSGAKPYIRTGHVTDQNALTALQFKEKRPSETLSREVLITFTTYTRNTWYPYAFSRNSQHVLPSASTLANIWDCIPCILKGDGRMPSEIIESDDDDEASPGPHEVRKKPRIVGYNPGEDGESGLDSLVMVVEDTAYSDGRGTPGYTDKLFAHLELLKFPRPDPDAPPPLPPGPYERPKRSKPLGRGPPIHMVPLRSLALRISEPYWILHRGNCEHWFSIDEIRLQNPRDPTSGYPIALQRTPTFLPLCRICSKVPATLSILNDVRLAESPAMVCKPCWDLFGGPPQPKDDDITDARVIVVPILSEPS